MFVRRVVGGSMLPGLRPGSIIIGTKPNKSKLRPGDIVVVRHDGLDKVKRIAKLHDREVYVLGDNPAASTDSRHFGWLPLTSVVARIIWPPSRR